MKDKPERWRLFCAVEIPDAVRARVMDHVAQLRAAAPSARASWARLDALHVTLKFLGEIESHRVPSVTRAAVKAAQNIQSFSLGLEKTGAFPPSGAPRVLWLGVSDPSGNLAKLQQSVEDELAVEGFDREVRKFHPHLTIARQRAPQGARTPAVLRSELQFPLVEFPVTEFVIMRSELRPEGSRYTRISCHSLCGA